jgi:hypothetical protein
LYVPEVVGVPESTPDEEKLRPGGVPEDTNHVYGGVPPEAVMVWEYAAPMVPEGSGEVVVTTREEAMASTSGAEPLTPTLSVASTVKSYVPEVEGVPESTPARERLRPGGSVPEITDHVYGDVPLEAVRVWEYAAPAVPDGSEVVVTTTRFPATKRLALAASTEPLTPEPEMGQEQ